MLTELKLLHAYIGGLIEEAENGVLDIDELYGVRSDREVNLSFSWSRKPGQTTGCDHDWRRIASGEYECRVCGAITDEPGV